MTTIQATILATGIAVAGVAIGQLQTFAEPRPSKAEPTVLVATPGANGAAWFAQAAAGLQPLIWSCTSNGKDVVCIKAAYKY